MPTREIPDRGYESGRGSRDFGSRDLGARDFGETGARQHDFGPGQYGREGVHGGGFGHELESSRALGVDDRAQRARQAIWRAVWRALRRRRA